MFAITEQGISGAIWQGGWGTGFGVVTGTVTCFRVTQASGLTSLDLHFLFYNRRHYTGVSFIES